MPSPNNSKASPSASRILEKAMVRLSRRQLDALRGEAMRRASAAGRAKLDVSALVREAIDAWLQKSPPAPLPLRTLATDASALAQRAASLASRLTAAAEREG